MSEDPYLTAKQCVEVIKGIQEHDVAACVKHYAMNSQETQRLWVDEGNSYSLMGAYNLIRGRHCRESKLLLNEVLRKEWSYEGLVVSDWGAVHKTKAAAETVRLNISKDILRKRKYKVRKTGRRAASRRTAEENAPRVQKAKLLLR